MADVILVCESCGDRRSVTDVRLGEMCHSCNMDGYRLGYVEIDGVAEPIPNTAGRSVVDVAAATVQLTDGSEGGE